MKLRLDAETYRILKWGKERRGPAISNSFVLHAEREAEEIVKKYGPPPNDFQ